MHPAARRNTDTTHAPTQKAYKITSLYDSSSTPTPPLLLKHRFSKAYRHASLDATLTKQRIAQETKCLARCLRAGVDVPSVKSVDVGAGTILMEWIEGHGSVREVLGGLPEEDEEGELSDSGEDEGQDENAEQAQHGPESIAERLRRLSLDEGGQFSLAHQPEPHRCAADVHTTRADTIMTSIGRSIASMHAIDVIHGDLTTSNMLLRSTAPPSIVLIDFGLSYVSSLVEDKAVDLYVLERALASTHPEAEGKKREDTYIERILRAYAGRVGQKEWSRVERRLKDGA